MTVRDEVKLEVGGSRPLAAPRHAGSTAFGSFRLLQVLLFGLTVAGVVVGWRIVGARRDRAGRLRGLRPDRWPGRSSGSSTPAPGTAPGARRPRTTSWPASTRWWRPWR